MGSALSGESYRTEAGSAMRGADVTQEGLFVTKQTSDYVPEEHPLIPIREILTQQSAI